VVVFLFPINRITLPIVFGKFPADLLRTLIPETITVQKPIPTPQNLKVLVSHHANPSYMAPIQFSENQVNCGPFFEDVDIEGRAISRKTPPGSYDIKKIVDSLPKEQKPDMFFAKADATRSNLPCNIGALGIPTVLNLGDMQHQKAPVQTLLKYAASEPYSVYVADHMRRHLHYFNEIGLSNVYWAPGISVKNWNIPFQKERNIPINFVGQMGEFHPYRNSILGELMEKEDIPIKAGRASQEQASQIYARSLISLNFTMNGDSNLRIFEVLAAGGFLMTDKLHAQAGIEILFDKGIHLEQFEGVDDLYDKCKYYLKHPAQALKIAWQGYQEFQRSHSTARKCQQIIDLAFKGWSDSSWNSLKDKRALYCKSTNGKALINRISNFEYFQQKQLEGEQNTLLFSKSANINLTCDTADLFRTKIYTTNHQADDFFIKTEVNNYIEYTSLSSAPQTDYYIASTIEFQKQMKHELKSNYILLEDFHLQPQEKQTLATQHLREHGYLIYNQKPALYTKI